jgi:glycerol kinase
MGKRFIIAIDLGTTGNRIFCFDETGFPLSNSYREFTQIYPKPGWVEHNPLEIWNSVTDLLHDAMQKASLNPSDAISIGITNQRETTVVWNRETGKPVCNAIVWQCRRTSDICHTLQEQGFSDTFRRKTGLVIDAYFSGTKIKWILDNIDGARALTQKGKLLFGTIDTWILWKLTGGISHKTDYTNASRTLVFNIETKLWDSELLSILDIPKNILPEVQNSASDFGKTKDVPGFPDGIMIGGMAGDQQSAMAGQNCVVEGSSKNTYGTGCFVLQNIGSSFLISKHGLITTLTCDDHGKPVYAFEGSVFIGGAVIQWLRDFMKFFSDSGESGKIASAVDKQDEVVFIPAFVGLGAPYWQMDTRGAIFGLTRDTSREQIVRAAEKSIALQSLDIIEAMQNDSGKKINELKVDGGATADSYLMQYQSDILCVPVVLPEITESTALGAAYLAGITKGVFSTISEVALHNRIKKRYIPVMNKSIRDHEISVWKKSISMLLSRNR